MSYQDALIQIVAVNRAEVEAALAEAESRYERAKAVLAQAAQEVYFLRGLCQFGRAEAAAKSGPSHPSGGAVDHSAVLAGNTPFLKLHDAMEKVLIESPTGRLRAREIIDEIARQGLYRMKDGRLPETQQIHARAKHYPKMFGKSGSYFYAKRDPRSA